ncbi:T9SS type A sorting domain-containing protein [Mariniflexile sp. AS56]|uniref:T9SS type A sorting domain-containing protein n=1 Tax=Mariniflexile sp. AS56 TaxID=3063957 RepID=UPI0026ED1402|nr:T9SS type A sorting domain-containing protein [Mariniflexile sp. AS56]MDO7172449.1 T9SS type A sorting domain-containing protein [Mariniflexile sp. AS56]
MKTNYRMKTIKTGLAVFAMALSFTFVSAQTEDVLVTDNIRTITTNVYAGGPITIESGVQSVEGTTFKIQATLTPNSALSGASAFIESNGSNRYGVDGAGIEGDNVESIETSNLTVIDFDPGTTSYTVADISDLHFTGITLFNSNNALDQIVFDIVGGSNPGNFNIGVTATRAPTITFGDPYTNAAAVETTVGSTTGVTAFTMSNGTTDAADAYQIIGTNWALTFKKDLSLSVNDVIKKGALSIYPTVVENTFTVSKAFETLQLFDITGKTVRTFSATDALEVSGLVSGLYIVKIQSEVGIATGRLIIK